MTDVPQRTSQKRPSASRVLHQEQNAEFDPLVWQPADDVVKRFLREPRAASTKAAYRMDIESFFGYARDLGKPPLSFDRGDLSEFVNYLTVERRLAPTTINRRIAALSGLFKFAMMEGAIERDPMPYVRRVPVPQVSQELGLERDDLLAMLVAAKAHSTRAYALVSLLTFNGLRIGEILGADVEHFTRRRGVDTLRVVRKGAKVATAPLAPRVWHTRFANIWVIALWARSSCRVPGGALIAAAPDVCFAKWPPACFRLSSSRRCIHIAFATDGSPRVWTAACRSRRCSSPRPTLHHS